MDAAHLVAVLGRGVVGPDEPVVTADDLGFTRGDGCFDTARVLTDDSGCSSVEGLAEHLDRLAGSASALGLPLPSRAAWEALVADALGAWTMPGEATLRFILTRGREWAPGEPLALVTVSHVGAHAGPGIGARGGAGSPGSARVDVTAARRGITAVTLSSGHPSDAFRDAPWLLGGVKTLSYAVKVAARREAAARGADDAIFVTTDGYALDGTTSGLLVVRDGTLLTTPVGDTGLLASVTVDRAVRAALADGMAARHELIPTAHLYTSAGVWLVSSGRGPAPITRLDGRALAVEPELTARVARYTGF